VSAARPLSVSAYTPLPRKDADRDVVDADRSAERDHSVLCVEFGRRLCHSYSRRWPKASLAVCSVLLNCSRWCSSMR